MCKYGEKNNEKHIVGIKIDYCIHNASFAEQNNPKKKNDYY